MCHFCLFFFSSRRRHTRCLSDWSSDVCSSDLLEAMQNAGKHAGEGATMIVTLREVEGALVFEVADTGAGFALESGAHKGHGFVNMSDRVGAFGGSVTVDSAPGQGTKIGGRIPLAEAS